MFIGLSVALVLVGAVWDVVGAVDCLVFLGVLVAAIAGRLVLVVSFARKGMSPSSAGRWLTLFRATTLAAGLSWAVGTYLLFASGDTVHQVFLALAIAGICAGAVAHLSMDRVSLLVLSVPPLVVLLAMFLAEGGSIQLSMAAITALFLTYVVAAGGRFQRWLHELADLRAQAIARAEALEASEARYQDLFENSTELIQNVDSDGRIIFVNRAWHETLGYAAGEVEGRSIFEFIHPDHVETCKATLQRLMAGEDVGQVEMEIVAKDGRVIALEGQVSMHTEDGKPVSARAIFRDVTERRAAERKLVESELLLDSIFEHLPAMAFLKRASDLRFERFNRAGEEIAERSRDQVIGKTDYDLHPKEVADKFNAADRRALDAAGTVVVFEQPHRSASGVERVLRTAKVALRDAGGQATHLLGVAIDVTSQKRAEEQLRQLNAELEQRVCERTAALEASERFARSTIDALETEVAVLDTNGRIIATNAAWRQFFETSGVFDLDIAENDNYLEACERACEIWPSSSARQIADGVRDVLSGSRDRFIIEYPIKVADGEHWFICRVTRLSRAEPIYVVVTFDDVTEVHLAREEAAAGAQFVASLEEVSSVGIFDSDMEGNCRSVNRRWTEITGQTIEDSKREGWPTALHPEDRERVIETFAEATRERVPFMCEYRYLHPDGKVVWVIGQAAEVTDSAGRASGYVGTLTDITERRLLEAQLAQAVKMEAIGKLTGGMAHDFNNYLGVIIGNLDLLKEQLMESPTSTRFVEAALRGALRAADLTKSLLAFSRRQPLDPQMINVSERLGAAIGLLRRTLGPDVDLKVQFDEDAWPVRIDSAQLDSSVINLVNNARDSMADDGTLSIVCRNLHLEADGDVVPDVPPGDYVVIDIADTGTGIAEADLPRVFEPFFTTKQAGHGTGLGLSMVYGFVKQSGGHVRIDSEVGRGTTVGIYLPRERQPGAYGRPGDEMANHASKMGSETILVVEDNEQVRRTACVQLNSLGYRVLEAASAAAALPIVEDTRQKLDLLFTDVVMPGSMNGYALAAKVAELRPGIGILLTSGFPGEARGAEEASAQIPDLIGKPYRKTDLARAIRSALDAAEARRSQLAPQNA